MLFCIGVFGAEPVRRLKTVVLDPGHGGKDFGAISADKKYAEKNFVLDIAFRLRDEINRECPDVNVILTREKDEFIELRDRADKANKAGADLFISIHINAAPTHNPNGYSVHLLGKSSKSNRDLFAANMDVCRRENSVIQLEEDYSTTYSDFDPDDPESFIFMLLMQSSNLEQSFKLAENIEASLKGGPIPADRGIWQDPFLVLWRTSMPSVLVELGFISNANDLALLNKEETRNSLAEKLCKAFKEYKISYERSMADEDFSPSE